MSGIKRTTSREHPGSPPSKKRVTEVVHPFFSSKPITLGHFVSSPSTVCHYLHLDPFSSSNGAGAVDSTASTYAQAAGSPTIPVLQHQTPQSPPPGLTEEKPANGVKKVEIVFYDLDGTLIRTRTGGDFPNSRSDWQWWDASVPTRLKKEWEEGKHIVVLSNQGDGRAKIRSEWKAKLPLIAAKMPSGVPIRIVAAFSKTDKYRKPNSGMFDLLRDLYRSKGYEVDMSKSVYVGDAAGRLAIGGRKKDHGDTDYKLALNIGLKFVTPEEHFLGLPRPKFPEPPTGFHPSKINLDLPQVVPSNTPIARTEVEMVLFVGPPASGKTSFYRRHFSARYEHINQDTLKTRDRCLRVAEEALSRGKSVVIDNTNRNRSTRSLWVALSNRLNVQIRVFHFNTPLELAKHNNVYRACFPPPHEAERDLLPLSAFYSFGNDFERPEMDEGFDELRTVNFIWEGTEEQKEIWNRYMLELKR